MKKIISSRWFYVVLFLSACAIITNIFVTAMVKKKVNEEKRISSAPKIINTEKVYEVSEKDEKIPYDETPEGIDITEETEVFSPEEVEDEGFDLPVYGEVLTPFSGNELIYSKTLKEYRVHKGIDIKSPILSQVKAAASGVIESVAKDGLMGYTIVIDHRNGFKSTYSNLSTDSMVSQGDTVKKGDIISGVGDTALIETGIEAHLHFELTKDGKQVNPEEYF